MLAVPTAADSLGSAAPLCEETEEFGVDDVGGVPSWHRCLH
jgi:hypothetical protein